jgi:hypothetical protein
MRFWAKEYVTAASDKLDKPIKGIDPLGKSVLFNFKTEIIQKGFRFSNVQKCCEHTPKYLSHKGYKWEYAV